MDRKEDLDKRIAALSVMIRTLENKARKTEFNVVNRNCTNPDEAAVYCDTLATLRSLRAEMDRSLMVLGKLVDTEKGAEKVAFYDDEMKTRLSEQQIVDEAAAAAEEIRKCSSFGERIKILKKQKHLQTGELSRLSGISKGTIQRYQAGKVKTVSVNNIERLARAFDVDPGVVAGWDFM